MDQRAQFTKCSYSEYKFPIRNNHSKAQKLTVPNQSNRTATSITNALRPTTLEVHQAVSPYSSQTSEQNLRVHKTNFSSPDSLNDLLNSSKPDLVISTVSGGSHSTQRRFIDAAISAGVSRFMPAEFSHDSQHSGLQERLPQHGARVETLEYLRELAGQGKVSWCAVATGTPLDYALYSGNLGFDFAWQSATLHGSGEEKFAAGSVAWTGKVVKAIVEKWEDVKDRYLYASGLVTSSNEVLRQLERATGKEWGAGRGEVDECVREGQKRIEMGFPDAGMFLMERSVIYDRQLDAVKSFLNEDAKEVLGLKPERLEDIVSTALHHHEHHGKGGCGCD